MFLILVFPNSWGKGNSQHELRPSRQSAVDEDLLGREDENYAAKEQGSYSIFSLSTKCSSDLPEDRIDMKDVVVTKFQMIKKRFLQISAT
ncbi:hypothetical protein C1H46_026133 [Malus baccata]|uniref:Uncharacterized protein n=1 Tax=Malus baccata TaxID=106549 RepID=A0A540LPQ8_MALBA|nr:hypothetical protein C1H46_026133 [Malus baccata]